METEKFIEIEAAAAVNIVLKILRLGNAVLKFYFPNRQF